MVRKASDHPLWLRPLRGHLPLTKALAIPADQINQAWESVVNKKARYRYVIDAATF